MKGFKRYSAEKADVDDPVEDIYVGFMERGDVAEAICDAKKFFDEAGVGPVEGFELQTATVDHLGGEPGGEALTLIVKYRQKKPRIWIHCPVGPGRERGDGMNLMIGEPPGEPPQHVGLGWPDH